MRSIFSFVSHLASHWMFLAKLWDLWFHPSKIFRISVLNIHKIWTKRAQHIFLFLNDQDGCKPWTSPKSMQVCLGLSRAQHTIAIEQLETELEICSAMKFLFVPKIKWVHQNKETYSFCKYYYEIFTYQMDRSQKHINIHSSLLILRPPFFTLNPTPFSLFFNFKPFSRGWSLTSKKPFFGYILFF